MCLLTVLENDRPRGRALYDTRYLAGLSGLIRRCLGHKTTPTVQDE